MKALDDLRIAAAATVVVFVLLIAMSAGLAHCTDVSTNTKVELISMYVKHKNPKLPQDMCDYIAFEIVHQAYLAGIPYEIVAAIMCVESNYNPGAIGPMGEIGLMQIYTMECNGVALEKTLLYVIEYNIAAGICILLDKLEMADGDIIDAIRRYNGSGPGAEKFKNKVCRVILDIFRFRVANREAISTAVAGVRG